MVINVKTPEELAKMRVACAITRDVLLFAEEKIKAGMTTGFLDKIIRDFIERHGATPSFLDYHGYPASSCISIDDEVVHGIPSDERYIEEGMIVSVDVGAYINGFHGDAARTFIIGEVDEKVRKLVRETKESFFAAARIIKPGTTIGDIGYAVSGHVKQFGYGVVKEMVGHGIGRNMHEFPDVPNYGVKGKGIKLVANNTIAVEPMINLGAARIKFMPDGWTVKTYDGKPSAHYENTILVTEEGCEILTL